VFESQASYASPAYWPRPVLQEVAV
jgi:hypothetical protein